MSRAEWFLFFAPFSCYVLVSMVVGGLPAAGAAQHGLLVASFAGVYLTFRLALVSTPLAGSGLTIAAAVPLAAWLALSLAFYSISVGGIAFWGRPPTFQLVAAYATDIPALLDQIEVSKAALGGAILSVSLLIIGASWAAVSHGRSNKNKPLSAPVALLFMLAALGVSRLSIRAFVLFPLFSAGEPLRYFLFPPENDWDLHGLTITEERMASLELAEDLERQNAQGLQSKTNVVVFVVDSLRAQNLEPYGYKRETMPRLQRTIANAEQSAIVRNAYSTCNESACGIISIAASRFAFGFHRKMVTLNEILRESGYQTFYLLGGDHTNFYGLRNIYGEADVYTDGFTYRGESNHKTVHAGTSLHRMNDDRFLLEATLSLPDHERPTYIHYHLQSVHSLGVRSVGEKWLPSKNYSFAPSLGPTDNQSFINFYDNGIIQADEIISKLLQTLAQKGYLNDALLVVTSDHGEYLGEHGKFSHGNGVDDVALRIPLIFMRFGEKFRTDLEHATFASQVDIAPTILSELGLATPSTWHGQALKKGPEREYSFFYQNSLIGLFDHRTRAPGFKFTHDIISGTEKLTAADGLAIPVDAVDPAIIEAWNAALSSVRDVVRQ